MPINQTTHDMDLSHTYLKQHCFPCGGLPNLYKSITPSSHTSHLIFLLLHPDICSLISSLLNFFCFISSLFTAAVPVPALHNSTHLHPAHSTYTPIFPVFNAATPPLSLFTHTAIRIYHHFIHTPTKPPSLLSTFS